MGAYDCDCINNLEYDRRERKAQLFKEDTTKDTTSDLISRQAAIEALTTYIYNVCGGINKQMSIDRCEVAAKSVIGELPTVQPNTSELINRIRSEINSKNRNSADYFIVDRIERIVNEWENEHGTDSN